MSDGRFVFPAEILNEDATTRHGILPLGLFNPFRTIWVRYETLYETSSAPFVNGERWNIEKDFRSKDRFGGLAHRVRTFFENPSGTLNFTAFTLQTWPNAKRVRLFVTTGKGH